MVFITAGRQHRRVPFFRLDTQVNSSLRPVGKNVPPTPHLELFYSLKNKAHPGKKVLPQYFLQPVTFNGWITLTAGFTYSIAIGQYRIMVLLGELRRAVMGLVPPCPRGEWEASLEASEWCSGSSCYCGFLSNSPNLEAMKTASGNSNNSPEWIHRFLSHFVMLNNILHCENLKPKHA